MADIVSLLSTGSQLAAFDWSIVIECVSLDAVNIHFLFVS